MSRCPHGRDIRHQACYACEDIAEAEMKATIRAEKQAERSAAKKPVKISLDYDDLLSDLKSRGLVFVDADGDEHDDQHVEACLKQAIEYQLEKR